jgi:hypothetical protein
MGTLRSYTNWSHQLTINGVGLGNPVERDGDPLTYEWDHGALPNGMIDADGNVIVDEPSLPEQASERAVDAVETAAEKPKRRSRSKKAE